MTRIVIEKSGITTDVPENELTNFLRLGYTKVGTLPDALPEKDQKPTAEEGAVNDALVDLSAAQKKLSEAENANNKARKPGQADPLTAKQKKAEEKSLTAKQKKAEDA